MKGTCSRSQSEVGTRLRQELGSPAVPLILLPEGPFRALMAVDGEETGLGTLVSLGMSRGSEERGGSSVQREE